jgi:transposase
MEPPKVFSPECETPERVYIVELYAAVRRAVQVEGISEREAARRFGIARKAVRKMLAFSVPPGYQRKQPVRRPKLEAFLGIIDEIVATDQKQPRKQRHTAKRIFERLKEEHGYQGGYTVVKDYLRARHLRQKEMFVPLVHPPGQAQVDFGEADILRQGVGERAHFFVMDLPHSDDAFVMVFPAETTEAFLEGHSQAFQHFGGVPRTSCTTTPNSRSRASWETAPANALRLLTDCFRIICFRNTSGVPGKATTKAKWRHWSAMPGATSWSRCPVATAMKS